MIETVDLTKKYGDFFALESLTPVSYTHLTLRRAD